MSSAPVCRCPGRIPPASSTPRRLNSDLAPNLPTPAAGDDIRSLLPPVRRALSAGRTGEAQETLERAATRAPKRSVTVGTQKAPAGGPLIAGIGHAPSAIGAGNAQA